MSNSIWDQIIEALLAVAILLLNQTQLDPKWQPTILASPAQLAGFDLVLTNEVPEAIGNETAVA